MPQMFLRQELQLFRPQELDREIYTIPFHWYVKGEVRDITFELFWRPDDTLTQTLKGVSIGAQASGDGITNAEGREIIDNSYLLAGPAGGPYTPIGGASRFTIGDIAAGSFKPFSLRLNLSPLALTTGRAVVQLNWQASLETLFYGARKWGPSYTGRGRYGCVNVGEVANITTKREVLVFAHVYTNEEHTRAKQAGLLFPKD